MGKIIGAIIGSILGPLGTFLGFIIGSLYDSFYKKPYYNNFNPDLILEEVFPLFAAAFSRAGEVDKKCVLTTKMIALELFTTEAASRVMQSYKKFIEKGYNNHYFQSVCSNVLFSLDYSSKIYILTLLFAILKVRNSFSLNEIYIIEKISYSIGISPNDFEDLLKKNRMKGEYYQKDFTKTYVQKSDPYAILELKDTASVDEIKKQYRLLCKKYHPDLTGQLPEKEREASKIKMKEIINAYEKIKKEKKFN